MSRLCILALTTLIGAAACARPKPLSPDGSSGATIDASRTVSTFDADGADKGAPDEASDTGVPDGAAADAPSDTLTTPDALVGFDGARVPYRAIAVATGELHTCAMLDDHRVKCWGANDVGQLGLGDTKYRGGDPSTMGDNLPTVDLGTGRTAVAIAAGREGSCAILDDSSVKCWGEPSFSGQSFFNASGDAPGEMGDNLPALDFGGRRAVNIGMAYSIACASMDDDTIWCWPGGAGPNAAKPAQVTGLPAKRVKALGPSGSLVAAVYDDGTLSADLPSGPIPQLPAGRNVVAVAGCTGNVTCVLFDDGTTACNDGTNGLTDATAIAVEASNAAVCAILTNGNVQCQDPMAAPGEICAPPYQCATNGVFTSITLGAPAVAVTSNGSRFMCALLADGNIKCWGAEPTAAWLGASLDFTTEADGGIVYGAWHTVDLGTH